MRGCGATRRCFRAAGAPACTRERCAITAVSPTSPRNSWWPSAPTRQRAICSASSATGRHRHHDLPVGAVATAQGDLEKARRLWEESREIWRQAEDPLGGSAVLGFLGVGDSVGRRRARARTGRAEPRHGSRRGWWMWVALRQNDLAEGQLAAGRTDAGELHAREAMALGRAGAAAGHRIRASSAGPPTNAGTFSVPPCSGRASKPSTRGHRSSAGTATATVIVHAFRRICRRRRRYPRRGGGARECHVAMTDPALTVARSDAYSATSWPSTCSGYAMRGRRMQPSGRWIGRPSGHRPAPRAVIRLIDLGRSSIDHGAGPSSRPAPGSSRGARRTRPSGHRTSRDGR